MKISTLIISILLLSVLGLYASPTNAQASLDKNISIEMSNVPLKKAFEIIGQKAGVKIVFSDKDNIANQQISLNANKTSLRNILNLILHNRSMRYEIVDDYIIIHAQRIKQKESNSKQYILNSQYDDTTITGQIVNEKGDPLAGVTVRIIGTKRDTLSNEDGVFTLSNVRRGTHLEVSLVGFVTQKVAIDYSNVSDIKIVMIATKGNLDDVIVTGYQTISKSKFTGAAVTLKADSIKIDGITDISRMLEGRAAGVSVQNVSGTFGSAPKLRIRGATSISGENKPLWVVDGVVLEDIVNISNEQLSSGDASTLLGSSVAGLNINDIETFDILKDASAVALYGARAMNGVVVITTKKGKNGTPRISYTGNFGIQLKPSYNSYDIMNSSDMLSVYNEVIAQEGFDFAKIANARNSGIIGKVAQQVQYPDENGNFEVYNNKDSIAAALMKYASHNTNWFSNLFQNSVNQQHTLSISSGSDKSQSYFSTSFYNDPGWSIADKVKLYTVNANLTYSPSKKFNYGFLVNGSVRQQRTSGAENRNLDSAAGQFTRDFDINPFNYALRTSRALPIYNDDGSLAFFTSDFTPFNILYETQHNYTNINLSDIKLQGNLSYKIIPSLTYQFIGSIRYVKSTEEHIVDDHSNEANAYRSAANSTIREANPYLYYNPDDPLGQKVSVLPYGGFYNTINRELKNYTFRNTINYNHTFNSLHQLNILAGQELRSIDRKTNGNQGVGYQYDNGGTPYVNYLFFKMMSERNQVYYGLTNEYDRTISYFGNAGYTFDNKYTLNATIRTDGSNKMGGPSNRWLPTWTVAGNWNLGQENWLLNSKFISSWIVRGSYGLNASTGSANNSTVILRTGITPRYVLSDQQTVININQIQNADLTWEKKYELDFGTDITFFNNRMNFTFDYYNRKSFDLIGLVRTSGVSGQVSQYANYADMKSHGLEFTLGGKPFVTKDFYWSSNINISYNTTKITNDKSQRNIYSLIGEGGGPLEGYPVRGLFSLKNEGLNPDNGAPLYINEKGEISSTVNISSYDISHLKYEGPSDPTIYGGWSNTFKYKNFSITSLITFQAGNKVRLTPVYKSNYNDLSQLPNEFKRRWSQGGDDLLTNIPSIAMLSSTGYYDIVNANGYPYDNYNFSHDRVASGNFIRMKAVTINYTLPKSWTTNLNLSSINFAATANNLFLIYSDSRLHGQDPEFFNTGGVALPVNKQITLSLKVGL